MRRVTVTLDDDLARLAEAEVKAGRASSVSAWIVNAIRAKTRARAELVGDFEELERRSRLAAVVWHRGERYETWDPNGVGSRQAVPCTADSDQPRTGVATTSPARVRGPTPFGGTHAGQDPRSEWSPASLAKDLFEP